MKITLFTLGSILFFIGAIFYLFPAPCKNVLTYSIGTLDTRFGISREELLERLRKAEDAWEQASGKDLFAYDPNSSLAVNLVYDERQEKTDRAKEITSSLNETAKTREGIKKQYDSAYAAYTKAEKLYTAHVASYETDAHELASEIQNSNAQGGASSEEYKRFQDRQRALEQRRENLEKERVALNALALQVNKYSDTENSIVETYNEEVGKLKEEFGDDREFGQGEYNGKDITIYEFTDQKDLLLVLEHEMGHALGIGHLPNPASVMYYLVHKGNVGLSGPTPDDIAALNAQCKKTSFTIFIDRLRSAYTQLVLE